MTEHQRTNSDAGRSLRDLLEHVKYEHLVSGLSGGVSATLALHPLDVIKVRLQGIYFRIVNALYTSHNKTAFPGVGKIFFFLQHRI